MANSWVTTAMLLLVVRSGVTLLQDRVSMPGDITLGGLFSVQTNTDGSCGDLHAESIQMHQAVRWFLSRLNIQGYIPGVTLGLTAFKTCDDPSRAVEATIEMLMESGNATVYGLIGPRGSSETQTVSRLLSSLPADDRLLQLSYSATATTLSDKSIYKNLYRVIAADNVQVQVLHELLVEMKWNYVAIVYETGAYGREGATALRKLAEKSNICVPVFYGIAVESGSEERRIAFATLADKLEKQSDSPVVGLVFFGLGITAKTMFSYLTLGLKHFQVIASEAISLNEAYMKNSVGVVFPRAKGLLTLSPPVYDPTAFKDYWTRLHSDTAFMLEEIKDNDWLLNYMESVTSCDLAGKVDVGSLCIQRAKSAVSAGDVPMYTSYVLMAVASVAKTLKGLQSSLCSGQPGVCDQMKNVKRSRVIEKLETLEINTETEFTDIFNFNFSFGFQNGEIKYNAADHMTTYSVYNYRSCGRVFCFTKVGDYIQDRLQMLGTIKSYEKDGAEMASPAEAQCQAGFVCTACTVSPNQGEVLFIPGDFYVVGLVPIHGRGDSYLDCGSMRPSPSVDLAESLAFAVGRARSKQEPFVSVLGGKNIGLIVIDTCNTALITKERIIRLHMGTLQLTSDMNSSSVVDRIIGYIGPYGSSLSVPVSSVMTELDKLYISYGSTSTRLSSRTQHPNFMRTCSPDYKQADFIMYLAKELGSKYVQLIYSDEEYGKAGKDSLKLAARKHEICIAQSIPVEDSDEKTKFIGYVAELRRYRHARVVIIFVRSHVTAALMDALTDDINSGEFLFIGGESWGRRELVLKHNPQLLGSLTLAQELPKNQRFGDYFASINVQQSSNPWIQEFIESRSGCYYPMSFNKGKKQLCTSEEHGQVDTWVPFAVNGAYSLVLGFNSALKEKCSGAYTMCPEYSTEDLKKHVKKVRLDINNDGGKVRVFDDNGEGDVGYTLYQVVREGTTHHYKKVGSSTEDGTPLLKSRLTGDTDFSSTCPNEIACEACKAQFNTSSMARNKSSEVGVTIGLGVAVGVLLVIILVLVIAITHFRRSQCVSNRSKDDVYLSVVHDPSLANQGYSVPKSHGYSTPADNPAPCSMSVHDERH